MSSLVQGSDGKFYGTTAQEGPSGKGTVFQIDTSGSLTTLHGFGGPDGASPRAGLIQGSDGSFYGTTKSGGAGNCGTVFQIDALGIFNTLYGFDAGDGANPAAGLVQSADGSLYGTTSGDDADFDYPCIDFCGTLFHIDSSGALTTLYRFTGGDSGSNPHGGLVTASDGSYYGTTKWAGANGLGTVFRVDASGVLTTLHSFDGSDGANPTAELLEASDGNYYGTTSQGGGDGFGTVFRIDASGSLTTLHSFAGGFDQPTQLYGDGATPVGGVVQGSDGKFYGTTRAGGSWDSGVIFRMTVPLSCYPAVAISAPVSICAGQTAVLDAGPGFSSYLWSTGATSRTITVSPTTTTAYSVDVVGQFACSSSASTTITANTVPAVPTISQAPNPDGSVTLTSSGASSYLWSTAETTQSISVSIRAGTRSPRPTARGVRRPRLSRMSLLRRQAPMCLSSTAM